MYDLGERPVARDRPGDGQFRSGTQPRPADGGAVAPPTCGPLRLLGCGGQDLGGEPPGRTALDAHVVRAAVAAARDVRNGEEPIIYPWLPGSPGPVWPVAFAHGVPLVSFGAAYPNSSIHAANENLRLDDYFQAIRMMGRFLASFANVGLP